jgi:D-alanine-D-alanine ligase
MRIGITYNLKINRDSSLNPVTHREPSLPDDTDEEFDHPETIEAIKQVLISHGHEVISLGGDLSIINKIREQAVDFVFNIAEGLTGRSREAHIPSILEMMDIPYTGSDPLALALALDKALTKRIALSLNIPTPQFWTMYDLNDLKQVPAQFPLFAKPLWQGSSKGIRRTSKVSTVPELEHEIRRLLNDYPNNPVLVEKYIPGREFTVGVIGSNSPRILGIMEIAFADTSKQDFLYSLETKRNWKQEVVYHCPPALDDGLQGKIANAACLLFKALGLRDCARFDFRVDNNNSYYFLEVNPLPGLSPESGDLVILAQKTGMAYPELISRIIDSAFQRYNLPKPAKQLR